MGDVTVVGAALPGLAVAARLAKAGHAVTVLEAEDSVGGRWRDPLVWPAALALPAAWKDLFRKSGRILDVELTTAGLALVEAPPVIHLMPDGKQLRLPTDRAGQFRMIHLAYGEPTARAWQDLLDRHDETWQRLRPLGLEADEPLDRARWQALGPDRTLADEAHLLGPLAPLVEQLAWPYDMRDVPAWECARLCVDRTFGRWIVTRDGDAVAPTALLTALGARLSRRATVHTGRRVTDVAALDGVVVDTTSPWSGLQSPPRGLRPALAPTVTAEPGDRFLPEVVDHAARTRSHSIRGADGWVRVTHDHATPVEDPSAGARPDGVDAFRRRPTVTPQPRRGLGTWWPRRPAREIVSAHAASRGGPEPWQQLLTAALAAYRAHELSGGPSIRPVDDPRKEKA